MANPNDFNDFEAVRGILGKISFLGGFNDDEIRCIFDYFKKATFSSGDSIVRKGEEPTHIYIIQSGRVELRIVGENKDVYKREFVVGDHFGEVAMLALVNKSANFVALDDCELIAFPRSALSRLRKENSDLFCRIVLNLARDLARKVQYSDDLMLES